MQRSAENNFLAYIGEKMVLPEELVLTNTKTCDLIKTADSDTVSTYQVSSVQLVTDKLLVTNCTEET